MEKRIGESEYQDLLNRQTRDPRAEVRERGEIQVSGIGRGERERETMGSGHKYACLRGPVVHVRL